jgi:hypothetical protein
MLYNHDKRSRYIKSIIQGKPSLRKFQGYLRGFDADSIWNSVSGTDRCGQFLLTQLRAQEIIGIVSVRYV